MANDTPLWVQAGSYAAGVDRALIDALYQQGGIVDIPSWKVGPRALGANMSVDIGGGSGVVVGTDAPNQGKYLCRSIGVTNLPIAAAPGAGLSRWSLIVATVRDANVIGGINNDFIFQEIAGTAAASPVIPAAPASSTVIAEVLVQALVTSIGPFVIIDLRQFAGRPATMPSAAIKQTAARSIPDNAEVEMQFDSSLWDTITALDPAYKMVDLAGNNKRIRVPIPGKYRVWASSRIFLPTASPDNALWLVRYNSSGVLQERGSGHGSPATANGFVDQAAYVEFQCNQFDFIEALTFQHCGAAQNTDPAPGNIRLGIGWFSN